MDIQSLEYDISMKYLFCHSWYIYRKNFIRIVGATALVFIAPWIRWLCNSLPYSSIVYQIFWFIVGPPILAGYAFYCLHLVRGLHPTKYEFLMGFRYFSVVWAVSFIYSILVTFGLLMFIIPGIIIILKYGLSIVSIIDKKLSVSKAMKFSSLITTGHKSKLFKLLTLNSLVILFQIPFYHFMNRTDITFANNYMKISIISYLFTIVILAPLFVIAWMIAYDTLSKSYNDIPQFPPT